VRGADHEVALMAILQAQQLGAVLLPAPRFLPKLGGLHGRHEQLEGARAIHFFADDLLDLAQTAQAEGCPGVDAGGESADETGAQHQLMADDLRFGRGFFRGIDRISGPAHGEARLSVSRGATCYGRGDCPERFSPL
jgi:hypothetical protein